VQVARRWRIKGGAPGQRFWWARVYLRMEIKRSFVGALCVAAGVCALGVGAAFAQDAPAPAVAPPVTTATPGADAKRRVEMQSAVAVTGATTPEGKEYDDLARAYSTVMGPVAFGCAKTIDDMRNTFIPQAQQAKFANNKAMYLGLAYGVIASCEMRLNQFAEAEQCYRDTLAQADAYPGGKGELYAGGWYALSRAQMMQGHWKDVEASASKAAELYQGLIDEEVKAADAKAGRGPSTEPDGEIYRFGAERAKALAALANAYVGEQRLDDAAKTIEQAYVQAGAARLTGMWRDNIISKGKEIAALKGDSGAMARWVARAAAEGQSDVKPVTPKRGASGGAGLKSTT
jgi:hypothetical protein